ncbi:MAG: putative M18 family aminopeptidase 2 [Chlamydiia bacterium]|nr:putative M18 family aminopeptidase 2 [Chlamydiia bacterium]MCH9616120.1 putative M18 family aminopeptidase 2 [Chlamydiia bacterium]MCH9629457.1 putative M18 family aminopeptidase 2 [Chlamydiia bacterium]
MTSYWNNALIVEKYRISYLEKFEEIYPEKMNTDHLIKDLMAFLDSSYTSFHASHAVCNRLAHCGFTPLELEESWKLEAGQGYFVERDGSAIAFRMPKKGKIDRFVTLGAHTDSPCLKLKPNPLIEKDGMIMYRTEKYGGPLLKTFFDRDLCVAGRLINESEELVTFDAAPVIIPSLAIHLKPEDEVNEHEHMCPLVSLEGHPLHDLDGTAELFLCPMERARRFGELGELLASARLDNLVSVHASVMALCHSNPTDALQVGAFWNNEEIGSLTAVGAHSPLFTDIVKRACLGNGLDEEGFLQAKSRSITLSCDNAHAMHPNYPGKHDDQNTPHLGRGVAIKQHGSMRYASTASSVHTLLKVFEKAKLPHQMFATRSDMRSGSTIGVIHESQTGIRTVDLGIPQLAMHSARETISLKDYLDLCHLLQAAQEIL